MIPIQSLPEGFFTVDVTDVISVFLSLILVILYWKMYRFQEIVATIQENQAKIMEKQTDFMEANHQPILDIEEISADGDEINITLQNRGNGPARNLLIQCVAYKQMEKTTEEGTELSNGYRGEGSVLAPKWNRLWRRSAPKLRADGGDQANGPHDGIETDEPPTQFEADLTFEYMAIGSGSYEVSFSEALERVSREWDAEYIALDFHIAFTDITRQVYSQSIGSFGNIPLDEGGTFEDALEDVYMGHPIDEPVSEDEVASMMPISSENVKYV